MADKKRYITQKEVDNAIKKYDKDLFEYGTKGLTSEQKKKILKLKNEAEKARKSGKSHGVTIDGTQYGIKR